MKTTPATIGGCLPIACPRLAWWGGIAMKLEPDDIQWPNELPLPACGDIIDPRVLGKCVVVETNHLRSPDGEAVFKHVKVRFFLPINTQEEKL